jgi:hypothetical protein
VEVADARFGKSGLQLPLREAGAARERQVADIDDGRDPRGLEGEDEIREAGFLVADGQQCWWSGVGGGVRIRHGSLLLQVQASCGLTGSA